MNAAALFDRRGVVDVAKVRQLPRLPETADELRALAASLGAPRSAVHLGVAASEPAVKGADLSDARVIAFATHGLMAGEFETVGEPALVLTPPGRARRR